MKTEPKRQVANQKPEHKPRPDKEERRYLYEERAAIHEFDGRMTKARAEMRAFLETGGPE